MCPNTKKKKSEMPIIVVMTVSIIEVATKMLSQMKMYRPQVERPGKQNISKKERKEENLQVSSIIFFREIASG